MFRLSLSTFRERWQLFVGAIVTVCVGVALVQSSLLILISTATAEAPAGLPAAARAKIEDAYTGATSLLGITVGFSVFLAAFIVSSTFAFTVAQRRRDLALLRLVGGGRGQLRKLLLSEALLLGLVGTLAGIPLGVLLMRWQSNLLASLDLLPSGFQAEWQLWILGVSFGVGVGVALGGVAVAARRAAKVRPLEALRQTGEAAKVMTASRWFFGILFFAGALAMVIIAPFAGPEGSIPLAINAALAASVALAALSPLVVPLVGRMFGVVLRGSVLAGLAQANLRDGVRRSASTAAPLLVLVAVVVGQTGAMASISSASQAAQIRDTRADLVVETTGPAGPALSGIPGVATVSEEAEVPVTGVYVETDEDKVKTKTKSETALAVDGAAYQAVHAPAPTAGSLAELRGMTVALGPAYGGDTDYAVGDTALLRFDDQDVRLRVVAILPEAMDGGAEFVLPREAVPPGLLRGTPAQSLVQVAPGADPGAVAAAITATGVGEVSTVAAWIERVSAARSDQQSSIFLVVTGLGALYALMAVINAVVIAGAERRREFAAARVTGLRRGQVVRSALIESWAVTTIGLALGGLAASLTLIGMSSALRRITGVGTVDLPWGVLGAVVAGAFLVVGVTSVATSLAATRTRPVALVGAGE